MYTLETLPIAQQTLNGLLSSSLPQLHLLKEDEIKFNSGKEKTTTFKFENFKVTKRGKILISGLNEMFSKNKKSFILRGQLENKHFVCESLVYKYNTRDINESNKNKVINVYGKAVVKR